MRFEHHITETWKSIVRQPYNRRAELLDLADHVAEHLGQARGRRPGGRAAHPHPSDILDYFRAKAESSPAATGTRCSTTTDKHDATNHTARALTEHGLSFMRRTTCTPDARRISPQDPAGADWPLPIVVLQHGQRPEGGNPSGQGVVDPDRRELVHRAPTA